MNTTNEQGLTPTGERYLPNVLTGDIIAEHMHRYYLAQGYVENKDVLDIACGEGYGSHYLAQTAASVVGVDVDPATVEHAQATYSYPGLNYRQGDCAAIPLPDSSVDVVVSFETIEHHDRHEAMMEEIKRVLRPEGLLIISSPDKHEYSEKPGYDNPYHVKELYKQEFEQLLKSHFANSTLIGQRVVYGSAMWDTRKKNHTTYSEARPQGQGGTPDPLYWVALASQEKLPELRSSFFQADIEHSDAVNQQRTLVHARDLELEQRGDYIAEIKAQHEASVLTLKQAADEERERAEKQLEQAEETVQKTEQALEHETHQRRQLLKAHAGTVSHANNPMWLAKQLLRRLKHLPSEIKRARAERYQIAASGLFDASWYLQHNPDVQATGQDPLKHYQRFGGYEARDPSANFDTLNHLQQHPWLLSTRQHPLVHYLNQPRPVAESKQQEGQGGANAGTNLMFGEMFAQTVGSSEDYVPLAEQPLEEQSRLRPIAFYLPQYHPIAENDRWWGKGFTEWTNVGKAVPQFAGHYQPRHPGELGYYDLRLPEVQERQAELARHYGVEAFCFHYYWFSGRKRLLERPIDQFANNPNIDFPFCLCWANENWTRRWDGKESDVLMEQKHLPEDDIEFIEDIAPLLQKPNYLRVNGKPLLIVYRVDILPDANKTAEVWRNYCREHGIGEIHLVSAQSFNNGDPRPYGFDASVEFPPHQTHAKRIEHQLTLLNPAFEGSVYDYADLVFTQLAKPATDYTRYRTVSPGWDNDARKPGRGHTFANVTPGRYQQWLAGAAREADLLAGDEKLVFINAWNEWAEGAYLEPDRRYGYAYLEATKQVVKHYTKPANFALENTLPNWEKRHETAVILHLYHTELWDEMASHLAYLEGDYDLYISLPEHAPEGTVARIQQTVPDARCATLPNKGRDVLPFLTMLSAIRPLGYGQVCKIHAKRSLHRQDGDLWRQEFLGQLLGSKKQVASVIDAFNRHPDIGMIGPAGHWLDYVRYWGSPQSPVRTQTLLEHLGIRISLDELGFFAGSMFWCRPEAMDPLLEMTDDDFEAEEGQTDGTLAHALERIFAAAAQAAGYRVTDTRHPDSVQEPAFEQHYPFAKPSPHLRGSQGAVTVDTAPRTSQVIERRAKTLYRSLKRRLK
nr:glycoside hydrolase family 99-like domain-containing protein [Halomonas sp. UBA3074]